LSLHLSRTIIPKLEGMDPGLSANEA
jgi:hypothetical protein